MYSRIADKIFLPTIDLLRGTRVYSNLRFFRQSQWWDLDRLKEYNNKRLCRIIQHCYENVPFYRDQFKKLKLVPRDIQSSEALTKLPTIDKKVIKENYDAFFDQNADRRKLLNFHTSGSTGEPFSYYLDKRAWSLNWALQFRCWEVSGWRFGSKRISIGGSALFPDKKPSLAVRVRNVIDNNESISATHMDSDRLGNVIERINQVKPEFIRGYPSALNVLSTYMKKENVEIVPIKAIFTMAEKLFPDQRENIQHAFNSPIFEGYGGSELGFSALECEYHTGLHFCLDSGIFEILTGEERTETGEVGELVYTNLENYAMPFLRYRSGDVVRNEVKMDCPCGRQFPLFTNGLEGRTGEILRFSNGRMVSPTAATLIFGKFNLDRYQMVQTGKDEIELRLVKGADFQEEELTALTKAIQHHCGETVHIHIRFLSDLPQSKSGKLQFIFSEIS